MLSYINNRRLRQEEGFTLTELVIYMLLVGIVAAIAVPSFILQRKNSADARVKSDIIAANNAIEAWIIKHPSKKIPSGTVSYAPTGVVVSSSLVNAGIPSGSFRASEGTSLTITGNTQPIGTFKISGKNLTGNKARSVEGLLYDSSKGGF